ncbi:MAG: hypothetical protein IPP72_00600 [Chitinophagaceae bacterium]|nr:hypothetical protein [Chitinophagaceae bacterium]
MAVLAIVFAATLSSCSKKGIKDPVTLDKAAGKWSINAIRHQIYTGSSTPEDSTVPWRPNPENFVIFDGVSAFQYAFNGSSTINGIYSFIGQDSISINLDGENNRWKILLLTPTNFNIERTSDNLHDFPGATVVTYQSFVR